jgi:lipopolysaccharide export system protein LptC
MNDLSYASADTANGRPLYQRSSSDGDRLFRSAMRHSRLVRFLRGAIPVGIVGILVIIGAAAYLNPFRNLPKLPVDPSKLIISGTKITMEAPRLAGFTRDDRSYEVTARAASQDLANPSILELKEIHARVEMQNKAVIELTADTGMYDTKADTLRLIDNIVLSSSAGYKGRLLDALIEVKKGRIVSEHPVEVVMLEGSLNANGVEVTENGALVSFGGGVHMDLTMKPSADEKQQAPAQ